MGPVRVGRLGADADGIAAAPDGTALFLAGALPGELVQPGALQRRGQGWAADSTVLEASAERVVPPCQHFGVCGGCSIQHLDDAAYAGWKRGLLEGVVRRLGFAGELPGLARTPPGARRRMDLAIRRGRGGEVVIGLHARRSAEVVDMRECPVLHPAVFGVVQALRGVLRGLDGLRREGSAVVNLVDAGPDLLLRTDAVLSTRDRQALTGLGVPRVSWSLEGAKGLRGAAETACLLRPAVAMLGGRATAVPPGAFLQASAEGERVIVEAVLAALPVLKGRARLVELFAGCGTLSHALAERGRVQAFEGDAEAVRALRGAGNGRVVVTQRDLVRQPLQAVELKGAGAVVLDPPYGGAPAQMGALAASGVPVIYVTCNPAALLRDGGVLVAAGYRVASAVAIDQFLWSARVEGVVGFVRG